MEAMLKSRRFHFPLLLAGALALGSVAQTAPKAVSDANWFQTVKGAKAIVFSKDKEKAKIGEKAVYAARTVVVLDDQLRAWGAVQRDVKAFKAANKSRGFFNGVAVPAPILARIGAARKQTDRLRDLGLGMDVVPDGLLKSRDHFADYCFAVDNWLDASKSLFATNDQMIFETLEQRALRVASRESQAGVMAMKAALK